MRNEKQNEVNGVLTEKMDVSTKGFDELQSILLVKSKERTTQQKQNIELLALKYEMEDYINSTESKIKMVGDFLKHFLKYLGIQQNNFATYIGLKPSNFSKLLSGERPVNYDLAIKFGSLFNHHPMLWIEVQAKNELQKLLKAKQNDYYNYSLSDLMDKSKNVA